MKVQRPVNYLLLLLATVLIAVALVMILGYSLGYFSALTGKAMTQTTTNATAGAAMPPSIQWSKTFAGRGFDIGYSVQVTSDGGYEIVGLESTDDKPDVWLIKTDSQGNKVWDKRCEPTDYMTIFSAQPTPDGGCIIGGEIGVWNNTAVRLVKIDSQGKTLWDKTYGEPDGVLGVSVQLTPDSGYMIVGVTKYFGKGHGDAWLVKTDSQGNMQWSKTYGGTGRDFGSPVQPTPDGGYILTGFTESFGAGSGDVWLIKIDSKGNMQWSKTYGETGITEGGILVQLTPDGGYIILGESSIPFNETANNPNSSHVGVLLIKTDSKGNTQWNRTYDVTGTDIHSFQITPDGGYVIPGVLSNTDLPRIAGAVANTLMIKTDSQGNELWQKQIGETGRDLANYVQLTPDGGYILVGHTASHDPGNADIWLVKLGYDKN